MTFEGDAIQPTNQKTVLQTIITNQITNHKTVLTTLNESGLRKKNDFKICVVPVVCLWMKE